MNNDQNEIDIDNIFDNLEIKPLTKGLGFHHSIQEEKKVEISLKAKQKSLQKDLDLRAKNLQTSVNVQKTKKVAGANSVNMGELAPFYSGEINEVETAEVKLVAPEKKVKKEIILQEAAMPARFLAWLLDVSAITMLVSFIPVSIVTFSSIEVSTFSIFMKSTDLLFGAALFFMMLYHFYFSFFDKTEYGTVGKRLLSLKVVNESNKEISFGQSFVRCLITVLSVVTLGVTSLLKFQDKITETKVVKKHV